MAKLSPEIEKILKQLEALKSKLSDVEKNQLDSIVESFKKGGKSLDEWNEQLESFRDKADSTSSSLSYIADALTDSVNELQKQNKYLSQSKTVANQILKSAQDALSVRKGETSINEKSLKSAKERIESQKRILELSAKNLKDYPKEKKEIQSILKSLEDYEDGLKGVLKTNEEINKELGFAPQLAGGLDKALSKIGLPSLGASEALSEVKKEGQLVAQSGGKIGKDFKPAVEFTKKMGSNLKNAFSSANILQAGILGIVNGIINSQKGIGDLAKGLGMSAERASNMRMGFAQIANSSGNINVSVKGLQESQMAIGKALGTNVMLNERDLETMTDIVKKTGLQHDELVGIQKLSLATGKSLDDNVKAALGGATAYASQNKLIVDNNKVLREVNSASSSLKLSLGGSVEALGEAVVKVQQLGMDLKTAEQIASSMLNFESSIEAELEAELLTGKNLNMERARQLALEGDIAGAAKEMADQLGSAEEFGKMNVIQQEALAKSIGLNRDALADSLIEREALAKMSMVEGETALERYNLLKAQGKSEAEIVALLGEKAAGQLEQQSAQEKFNATVEKLKEIFIQVGDALAPAFNILADMFGMVQLILIPFQAIFDFVGMIGSKISAMIGPLGKVGKVLKGLAGLAIVFAAYKAYASLATIPILGVPLGIAAAAAVTTTGFGLLSGIKTADDMFSPGEGSSGYGKRTLMGPEGAIQLNNKDTVIAGTNLFGNDVKSEPGKATEMAGEGEMKVEGANVDMTQTNALLNKIAILLSQPSVLTLDNNAFGEATKMASSRVE